MPVWRLRVMKLLPRRKLVSMCGSDDTLSCTGDNEWGAGWIIFLDKNSDGQLTNDDCAVLQDCVLQVYQLSAKNVTVQGESNFLTFDLEGARFDNGTDKIHVCPSTEESFFTISISAAGSKRTKKEAGQCA